MPVISLSRIIAFWAEQQPDRVAIDHEGVQVTWAEFEARTNRLARAYAALGVGQDQFVTIGLPNDNTGNRLHAIIDRPEGSADPDALMAHLNAHLVRYKTPRTFEWVNEPLRDEAGKVRRNALRQERLQS